MPPKAKFTEGERVLCFHGPLLYEAKVLKSGLAKDRSVKFFVHYAGWNKNWDEWASESRVLKFNDANILKQAELLEQHSAIAAKNKKAAGAKPKKPDTNTAAKDSDSRASTPSKEVAQIEKSSNLNTSTSSGRGRAPKQATSTSVSNTPNPEQNTSTREMKRGASERDSREEMPNRKKRMTETSIESEEQFLTKTEIKIKIPEELKPWLVDDWDAINRQHKLLEIPAKETVKDIIEAYIQTKKTTKSTNKGKEAVLNDVMNGLLGYFNVMLGSQLLYKSERPQYADLLKVHGDTPMANLYGSFHLLRLFVRLGSVLSYTLLDEKSINTLMHHVQDFLKYLVKNIGIYFNMQHFVNVTPEYARKAQ